MKKLLLALFVIALSASAFAQGIIHGNGDPSVITPTPNCGFSRFYIDESTQKMFFAAQGSPCSWVYAGTIGSGLSDPGSNGIMKRTASNTTAPAVAGTDYAAATSGSSPLKGNGAGGFSNVVLADILGLFTGTPSSGKFLSYDGSWATPAGSGGGISNGAGNNVIMKSDGTNAVASSLTDSSGVITGATSFNASGSISVGTAPTACGSATGCFAGTEASTAGTPTASQSYVRADSTSHQFKVSLNNGSEVNMLTSAGLAAIASAKTLTVSNSMTQTATDGSTVAFGAGGTVTYTIASGTSAMGTSAISSGSCATVVTTTATGTAATDAIIATPNADPTGVTGYAVSATGGLYIAAYPTSNNVNFKVCNSTGGSLTPSALTLNWRVVR